MEKYEILNSGTWGSYVSYYHNVSSQINIRRQNYFNIQKENIFEHSFLMTN